MRKNIIFGIGIILLLLPMVMPTTMITSPKASIEPSLPIGNTLDETTAGTKLTYNISEFNYGEGFFDLLDMLFDEEDIPAFDTGLIGSLEGTEISFYIALMRDLYLYQYDNETELYVNETLQTAFQALPMLELGQDIGAYVDPSAFTFPDDFIEKDIDYFYTSWPFCDFTFDITGTDFWYEVEVGFEEYFSNGWNDAQYGEPWFWMDWIDPDRYDEEEYIQFAYEFGCWQGYWLGADAYWQSGGNPTWNDYLVAFSGYQNGFLFGRTSGFSAGQADFLDDRIPDKSSVNPYDTSLGVYEIGQHKGYCMSYEMYYESGYIYQGAQINFNDRLYWKLYNSQHESWISGYIDGYDNYYGNGHEDGSYDRAYSNPFGTTYEDPEDYDDYDEWSAGFNVGMHEGYEGGYYDGFYNTNANEEKLRGMRDYHYEPYFEGFAIGAADKLASIPYDDVPDSTPYSQGTSNPYEQGANYAYENSYVYGYENGNKYATLVSSTNDFLWKISNGPFYNMNLPYIEISLLAGSILPIFAPLTMFTDLGFNSPEYEFWYEGPHGDSYDPFVDMMVPFTFYGPDSNWVELDGFDHIYNASEPEIPGIITTYDSIAGIFTYDIYMNMSGEGEIEYLQVYNTTSSLLTDFDLSLSFTEMADVWIDVSIDLIESETQYTPVMPNPSTWTYSVNNYVFYFEAPPGMDTEGLAEWKEDALASIGNPLVTVNMQGYDGLWAEADLTFYDPKGIEPPRYNTSIYPMMYPVGFQILPDWETLDGMWLTIDSLFDNIGIVTDVLDALDAQNINVDFSNMVIQPDTGKYLYNDEVLYYYITLSAEVDGQISMVNGDYEWETDTLTGNINATLWVAFEEDSGVCVGTGLRAGLDATLTQVPDYGNSGTLSIFLDMEIGVDYLPIPNIYDLGLVDLPAVPEFGIVSILSIIALAGIASAIITSKKR